MKRLFLCVIAIMVINASSVFADYTAFDVGLARETTPYLLADFTKVGVVYATEKYSLSATVGSDILTAVPIFSYNNDDEKAKMSTGNTYYYLGGGIKFDPLALALGYQFNIDTSKGWYAHTPHIAFESDVLRVNIPITVGYGSENTITEGITGLSTESEIKIYTQWEPIYYIRSFLTYTRLDLSETPIGRANNLLIDEIQQEFYAQVRFYFKEYETGTGLSIGPQIRLYYASGLGGDLQAMVGGVGATGGFEAPSKSDDNDNQVLISQKTKSFFKIAPRVAFSVSTDRYYFYIAPNIGYKVAFEKNGIESGRDLITQTIEFGTFIEASVNPTEDFSVWLEADPKIDTLGGVIFTAGLGLTWFY